MRVGLIASRRGRIGVGGVGLGVVGVVGSGEHVVAGGCAVGGVVGRVNTSVVPAGSTRAMICRVARKLVWVNKLSVGVGIVVVRRGRVGVGGVGVGVEGGRRATGNGDPLII